MSRRDRLAGVEHCKEYIRELFQAFKDGCGSEEAPFTLDLAVAAAWRKLDQVLFEAFPKELRGTVRMRVAAEAGRRVDFPGAVSIRKLGAREGGHDDVYYVVLPAPDHEWVLAAIQNLEESGCRVRDWEFYA